MRDEFGPISKGPENPAVLDFEKPLVELDRRIHEVRTVAEENGVDVSASVQELEARAIQLRQHTYSRLTPVQRLQVARHPNRPTFLDIAWNICDSFIEMHGDRAGSDDPAVVCGLARLDGNPMMFIGHQKGRNTKENIYRNFAMPQPSGYRKAKRFMELADKCGWPIVTFIDTPGAFAGKQAEERGQGEAIAANLRAMFGLRVPVLSVVIGEGGSGGALAIGCANRSLILENAVYYVASPEACAAILWKSRDDTPKATEALRITSAELLQAGVMDKIIEEPLGGAHRSPMAAFAFIKDALLASYKELEAMDGEECMADRYNKFRNLGDYSEHYVRAKDLGTERDVRDASANGVITATGRWAQNEFEKEYWDIFDALTEKWEAMLAERSHLTDVPAPLSDTPKLKLPADSTLPPSRRPADAESPAARDGGSDGEGGVVDAAAALPGRNGAAPSRNGAAASNGAHANGEAPALEPLSRSKE